MNENDINMGDDEFEHLQAELFEAISHPTRIRLLKTLMDQPLGFADLKHAVSIKSSGHLQHHLQKLGNLLHNNDQGKYTLSDLGHEAVLAIQTFTDSKNPTMPPTTQVKLLALIGALAIYVVQLNIRIFLGTVDILTPIFALLNATVFGILQWAMWKVIFQNRKHNP